MSRIVKVSDNAVVVVLTRCQAALLAEWMTNHSTGCFGPVAPAFRAVVAKVLLAVQP